LSTAPKATNANHLIGAALIQVAGGLISEIPRVAATPARANATRCCWPPDSCSDSAAQQCAQAQLKPQSQACHCRIQLPARRAWNANIVGDGKLGDKVETA